MFKKNNDGEVILKVCACGAVKKFSKWCYSVDQFDLVIAMLGKQGVRKIEFLWQVCPICQKGESDAIEDEERNTAIEKRN